MSRQAQLPPRCPFQKKTLTSPLQDPFTSLPPRHHKSISQSFIMEEQPAWLDELLSDSDLNSGGTLHRRSASDSLTLLDGHVSLEGFDKFDETESNASFESDSSGSKTNCNYGPNSPRGKSNITFADNAIVSALSEYVSPNPLQYLDRCISMSGPAQLESLGNASGGADANAEAKPMKRHAGQRSRVRKLQYIAELERTVNTYEALESDLAAKVATLLQQRVALSMENRELKQQMLRLQQEKAIVDAQYMSLRKELERLRHLARSRNSKMSTNFKQSSAADMMTSSEAALQMLDFGKLDLN